MFCIVFLQYNEINASTYCEQFCIKLNKNFSNVIQQLLEEDSSQKR